MTAAQVKRDEADVAKREWNDSKESSQSRRKELKVISKTVNLDTASAVISGDRHKKKDTHFSSRVRAFMSRDSELVEVVSHAMWSLRILVFVRRSILPQVSCVDVDAVACGGPGGNLGNKGCVAASLWIGSSSLCFISAHLAAHTEKLKVRNQNYHTIVQKLGLGLKEWPVLVKYDHVFFFGDLNYRLEMPEKDLFDQLRSRDMAPLFANDQLCNARLAEDAFVGFEEDLPTFFPTFKLVKRYQADGANAVAEQRTVAESSSEHPTHSVPAGKDGSQNIQYLLQRTPSFTDRILVKSARSSHHRIKRLEYDAAFSVATSDHAPVYSTFQLGVDSKRPLIDLRDLDAQLAPVFILLSGVTLRLKSDIGLESGPGHEFIASFLGPTFLSSSENNCIVPSTHFDASATLMIGLGSVGLACRTHDVDYIRGQKLFVKVASRAHLETLKLYGVLRVEGAFSQLGVGGMPFEVDMYSAKNAISPQGVLCGMIRSA